jgi:hypothetical protein
MSLRIAAVPSFTRVTKKLHAKDKLVLDQAIQQIANTPLMGEEKKGDLAGVFVHKFKLNQQETLLAYRLQPDRVKPTELTLLAVGPHENFYATLKR